MDKKKIKRKADYLVLCLLIVIFTNTAGGGGLSISFTERVWAEPKDADKTDRKAEKMDKVVFRINAANPSKEKTQRVPIKAYLPMEVKREDILDKGGLSLKYDKQKSVYYVYKNDLKLAPTETRTFPVKIKNIWVISSDKINRLRKQARNILQLLKQSEYYREAKQITDKVDNQLDEVVASQDEASLSAKERIGVYRSNLRVVGDIKKDLRDMEKLSIKTKKKAKKKNDVSEKSAKPSEEEKESGGVIERIKNIFGGEGDEEK